MFKAFRYYLFFFFYKFLIKLKSPKLIAFLIFISLRKLKGIKNTSSKKKIIILEKSFGIEDIRSSFAKISMKYEPYVAQRRLFSLIFKLIFGRNKIHEHSYNLSNNITNKKKTDLRKLYTEILGHLKNYFNVKIIINFNILYLAERELQVASKNNDIKFITLQKEGNFLESEKRKFINLLKRNTGKYEGDLIMTYSERYKKLLIQAGVVEKNKVKCIGVPRVDRFFTKKKTNQKYVLFFLIQTKRTLAYNLMKSVNKEYFRVKEQYPNYMSNLSKKAIQSTLNVAKKNPCIKFLFKERIKNQNYTLIQRNKIQNSNLKNCQVILGGDSFNYIKNAKVIIGVNSTSLMEGLAAKKKVLVPYFEANNNFIRQSLQKLSSPIIIVKNTKNFESILQKIINEKSYNLSHSKNAKKMLKHYIGNSDGKSYKRFAEIINRI